jgi:hypothetical protein
MMNKIYLNLHSILILYRVCKEDAHTDKIYVQSSPSLMGGSMPGSELCSETDHGINPGTRVKSYVHFIESSFNIYSTTKWIARCKITKGKGRLLTIRKQLLGRLMHFSV